jgi:hypothetical protein
MTCNCGDDLRKKLLCSAPHSETLPHGYYHKEGYLYTPLGSRAMQHDWDYINKYMHKQAYPERHLNDPPEHIPHDHSWKFTAWDYRLSRDRVATMYSQPPNRLWIQVTGNYPEDLPIGLRDARAVLYSKLIEDDELYTIMSSNTRVMRKKKAELFKEAKDNCIPDPHWKEPIF